MNGVSCEKLDEANRRIDRLLDKLRNAEIGLASISEQLEKEQAENEKHRKVKNEQ